MSAHQERPLSGWAERAAMVARNSGGGKRILVVDDVDAVRIMIHRALSANGYAVEVASTLGQARGMDPGGYDAVLVDAGLGAERGIDLVEALCAEDPAAARRCLVITGGTTDPLPDGVTCLIKPFQLDELLEAVHALHQPPAAPASGRKAAIAADSGPPLPGSVLPGGSQPAAVEPGAWQLLRLVRQLRASQRHALVDFLHDGPIQELTAINLELQMMLRAAQPDPAQRLKMVLQRLDAAAGSLRWLVDGGWPFMEPETRLAAALQQRTAWLLTAPVTVDIDVQAVGPTAIEIPVIVDVVELMLLGTMPADPPARAHVAVRTGEGKIQIELTLSAAGPGKQSVGNPATAQATLEELASALGATTHADLDDQHWGARVVLPRPLAPATA
jgi:CheY-like chemotaxis protein